MAKNAHIRAICIFLKHFKLRTINRRRATLIADGNINDTKKPVDKQ